LLISEFTRTLLEHFIKQIECPSCLAMDSVNGSNGDSGSLYKIGQSVASMFCEDTITIGLNIVYETLSNAKLHEVLLIYRLD